MSVEIPQSVNNTSSVTYQLLAKLLKYMVSTICKTYTVTSIVFIQKSWERN